MSSVRRAAGRAGSREVAPGARPSWSPDGRRLVYPRVGPYAPPSLPDVIVVGADAKGARRIAAGRTPLWSPAGGQIAYLSYDGLDVVRPDGRGNRRLVVPAPRSLWSWSPDATLIAFAGKGVDVVRASGGASHPVALQGQNASWSPRGHNLAWDNLCGITTFTVTDDPDHYDGALPSPYPCLQVSTDGPASWSPDGTAIVLSYCAGFSGCRIETVVPPAIRPAEARPLACGYEPAWSPATNEIVFSSSDPAPARARSNRCAGVGPARLYTMRSDGTHLHALG